MKISLLALLIAFIPLNHSMAQAEAAIVLPAKDAKLKGAIHYIAKTETINRWVEEGSSASWAINLPAGTYEVSMKYALGPESGGGRFEMSTESSKVNITSFQPTGSWNAFKNKILLPITISKTDKTFTITATKVPIAQGLMDLRSITLTKAR